jgi:Dit-like tail protein/uncharacterized protein DUF6983
MSGPLGFVLPLASIGLGSLLIQPRRGFFPQSPSSNVPPGPPLFPQVVVSEDHHDELQISDHPIEKNPTNASGYVSDHAIVLPKSVIIRCAWSDSPSGPSNVGSAILGSIAANGGAVGQGIANAVGVVQGFSTIGSLLTGNSPSQIKNIYDALISLQASCQPFSIYTGKRSYKNMLFKSLSCTTDKDTENILSITAACREVIIVTVQVINTTVNPSAQADPTRTSPTLNTGPQQLQDAASFAPPLTSLTGAVSGLSSQIGTVQSLFSTLPAGLPGASGVLNGALGQLPGVMSSAGGLLAQAMSLLPIPQEIPLIANPQTFSIPLGGAMAPALATNLEALTPSLSSLQDAIAASLQQIPSVTLPSNFSGLPGSLTAMQASVTSVMALAADALARSAISPAVAGSGNTMSLGWNPSSSVWVANIADAAQNPLVSGIPLVTGANLLEQFGHLGLSGQMLTSTDNNTDVPPTFDDLGTTSHLYFVGP